MKLQALASVLLIPAALASYEVSDSSIIQGELPQTAWGEGASSGLELQPAREEVVTPVPAATNTHADTRAPASLKPQTDASTAPRREPGAVASVALKAQVSDDDASSPVLWPQIGAEVSMRGHAAQKRATAEDALLPQTEAEVATRRGRQPGEVSPEAGVQTLPLSTAAEDSAASVDLGLQMDATVVPANPPAAAAATESGGSPRSFLPQFVGKVVDFGDKGSVHLFVLCLLNVLALMVLFMLVQGEGRRSPGERKARFFEKVLRSRLPMPRPVGGNGSHVGHPLPGSQAGHFHC